MTLLTITLKIINYTIHITVHIADSLRLVSCSRLTVEGNKPAAFQSENHPCHPQKYEAILCQGLRIIWLVVRQSGEHWMLLLYSLNKNIQHIFQD